MAAKSEEPGKHEQEQDARIERNAESILANQDAIKKQLAYFEELLNYFKPWRASEWDWYRTFRGKYYGKVLKLFAGRHFVLTEFLRLRKDQDLNHRQQLPFLKETVFRVQHSIWINWSTRCLIHW